MIQTIYTIPQIKDLVAPIAKNYGVERVFLFGSYARGEATEQSDIDILIDKGNIQDLFQLSGFMIDLKEHLGKSVDVVTSDGSNKRFLQSISKEEVMLYES